MSSQDFSQETTTQGSNIAAPAQGDIDILKIAYSFHYKCCTSIIQHLSQGQIKN